MNRIYTLLLLAGCAAPVFAADPAPLNFSLPGKNLPESGKYRIGRPTHFITGVLAFSADGKTLATYTNQHYASGIDAPVELWNVETGKPVATLRYHRTGVMAAAFSPDGTTIATSGMDNRLRFWDAKTGKDITVPEHITLTGHGYNLCFSPDGKRLLVGSTELEMYDVKTQQRLKAAAGYFEQTARNAFFHTATWSPKGNYIAAACDRQGVRVWDADGKFLYKLTDRYIPHMTRFAFSADDKLLLLAAVPEAQFTVHDAATGKEQRVVKPPEGERASEQVQFAREAGRVSWVVQKRYRDMGRTIVVADATGQEIKRFEVPAPVLSDLFSNDGKRIAVGGTDGSLRIYEADTGKLEQTLLGSWSPVLRTVYADGGKVLRTVHKNGTVHDFDADTGRHLKERTLKLDKSTHLITVSPDGGLLASATDDGACTVWNLATGAEQAKPKTKLHVHRELRFGPGGPFPLPPGLPPPPGPPPPPAVPGPPQFFAAFSADGKLFAAITGDDDAATVWDAATGEEKQTIKVAKGIGALAFSPDGAHLYAGQGRNVLRFDEPGKESDSTAYLRRYDVKTGKEAQGWKAEPGEKRANLEFRQAEVLAIYPLPDAATLLVVEELSYLPPPPPPGRFGPAALARFMRVRAVNLAGAEKSRVVFTEGEPALPTASPDGKFIGVVTNDASDREKPKTGVKVVDVATGKERTAELATGYHPGFGDRSRSLVFRPKGTDIAVSVADGTVLVIDGTKLKGGK